MQSTIKISTIMFLINLLLIIPFSHAGEGMRSISLNEKSYEISEDLLVTGNYWALIVGINKYQHLPPKGQLVAATNDAKSVRKILVDKYGFDTKRVISLYDDQATRGNIVDSLDYIGENIGKNDSLLIYYAGHGIYPKRSQLKIGSWLPYDGIPEKRSTHLPNSTVKDYLSEIPARHILVVADSCYSASLMSSKTRSIGDSDELNDRVIKELNEKRSRWVMTSGGLYPVPDAAPGRGGHSTFAYHLLESLKKNTRQYLPISELFRNVRYKISNDTDAAAKASPLRGSGDDGGEFIFANISYQDRALRETLKQESDLKLTEMFETMKAMNDEVQKMKQARIQLEEARKAQLQLDEARKAQVQVQLEEARKTQAKLETSRAAAEKKRILEESAKRAKQKEKEPVFVPFTF